MSSHESDNHISTGQLVAKLLTRSDYTAALLEIVLRNQAEILAKIKGQPEMYGQLIDTFNVQIEEVYQRRVQETKEEVIGSTEPKTSAVSHFGRPYPGSAATASEPSL